MVNLTIGGGAIKGFAFLGALEYLYINNLLNNIENFYGTSIGSIIGILFIIGYKPIEILGELLKVDFSNFNTFDLDHLYNKYSLLTDAFFVKMHEIFSKKEDINITIEDFNKKYNVHINIYSTELHTRKNININENSFPKLKVLTAVQASSSIPILFPPIIIDDKFYIDGCLKNIDGVNNSDGYIIKSNNSYKKINNFSDYLLEIINCTLQPTISKDIDNEKTIAINFDKIVLQSKYNFLDIVNSDKILLFYEGILQAKNKIKN